MSSKSTVQRVSLTLLLATAAMAENLHLKPGLWEITTAMQGGAAAPQIPADKRAAMEKAMERMPPEQRARMEAAMKGPGAGAPRVHQSCVAADDLKKPMNFDGGRTESSCTRTLLTSTATTQEVRVDCERNGRKSTGTFKMTATSPESWNSTLDIGMGESAGAPSMPSLQTKMSGKWISSDCGAVKPASQK